MTGCDASGTVIGAGEFASEPEHPGGGRSGTDMANQTIERTNGDLPARGRRREDRTQSVTGGRLADHFRSPHGRGNKPCLIQRLANSLPHRFVLRAGGRHAHPTDHAADRVARRAGIGQPLEHEHDRTLAEHRACATSTVDRTTRPVGEQASERPALKRHQVHAPFTGGTQHSIAFPLPEQVGRGRERRSA